MRSPSLLMSLVVAGALGSTVPPPPAAHADSADAALVWLGKPDGCRQCEPCDPPTLDAAVAEVERAGVPVQRAVLHSRPVCAACRCASGRLYAVRVDRAHASALARLGWSPLLDPPPDEAPAR